MMDFHPPGNVSATPLDTGMIQDDPMVVEFVAEGSASGPNVKCARGTSTTLTLTLATGLSITGTYIASEVELGIGPDQDNLLTVTFTPNTAAGSTWDLTT